MLEIIGGRIILTKGDSAILNLAIYMPDRETMYELQEGDIATFSVKKFIPETMQNRIYIRKQFVDYQVKLDPIDTAYLPIAGYGYDVELKLANGDVSTILGVCPFDIITGGVNCLHRQQSCLPCVPSDMSNVGNLIGILNNGIIEVPTEDVSIGSLKDVTITDAKDDDILMYEDGQWVNTDSDGFLDNKDIITMDDVTGEIIDSDTLIPSSKAVADAIETAVEDIDYNNIAVICGGSAFD